MRKRCFLNYYLYQAKSFEAVYTVLEFTVARPGLMEVHVYCFRTTDIETNRNLFLLPLQTLFHTVVAFEPV